MERLQEALHKARQRRSNTVQSASVPAVTAPVDQAWDMLTPFNPDPKLLERNRIVVHQGDKLGASLDILRTKILLTMRKNNWTRLAITSPSAACGKTTMACNISLGFGRQTDIRTGLFELDLRTPSMGRYLNLGNDHCISDMLAGDVTFQDQAQRYGSNVAISAAKRPVPDSTVVMLSNTTQKTLSQIENDYALDLMIFDLPPLLVSGDASAFLKQVDCALMVVAAEQTTVAQMDTCERQIADHCNVLGCVLNSCRHNDDSATTL